MLLNHINGLSQPASTRRDMVSPMAKLLRGPGPLHGLWSATGHPSVLEQASSLGPDFICLDTQHGIRLDTITVNTFTAMAFYGIPGLVRVPRNDVYDIGLALDLGAAGIMAPMIDDEGSAAEAVAACRYAPAGVRSFGIQTPRLSAMDPEYKPLVAVQIETRSGIENVDSIAAVDGVDWLYIGPADLGISLCGTPASDILSVFDGTHPYSSQMQEAFHAVTAACNRHGKLPGIHCNSGDEAIVARENGFLVYSVGADIGEATEGMAKQLRRAREG